MCACLRVHNLSFLIGKHDNSHMEKGGVSGLEEFFFAERQDSSQEKIGHLQQITTEMKAVRFEKAAVSARVRGTALPPPKEKKKVPPTVHSWDWTNQDLTAIFGQMVRQ